MEIQEEILKQCLEIKIGTRVKVVTIEGGARRTMTGKIIEPVKLAGHMDQVTGVIYEESGGDRRPVYTIGINEGRRPSILKQQTYMLHLIESIEKVKKRTERG